MKPCRPMLALLPLALAACGSDPAPKQEADDPALSGALADQIMVDPDLAQQNRADSAIAVSGPPVTELPPIDRSEQAIAAARAEALKLAGGRLRPAPAPQTGDATTASLAEAVTAAQVAQAAKGPAARCAGKAEFSAAWAAKLPPELAVYPRGAVQDAAGTDRDGCALRVVSFRTPVPPAEIVDWYHTRVTAAGYGATHRIEGKDHALGGSRGAAAYIVYARVLEDGLTEVDLVASGN